MDSVTAPDSLGDVEYFGTMSKEVAFPGNCFLLFPLLHLFTPDFGKPIVSGWRFRKKHYGPWREAIQLVGDALACKDKRVDAKAAHFGWKGAAKKIRKTAGKLSCSDRFQLHVTFPVFQLKLLQHFHPADNHQSYNNSDDEKMLKTIIETNYVFWELYTGKVPNNQVPDKARLYERMWKVHITEGFHLSVPRAGQPAGCNAPLASTFAREQQQFQPSQPQIFQPQRGFVPPYAMVWIPQMVAQGQLPAVQQSVWTACQPSWPQSSQVANSKPLQPGLVLKQQHPSKRCRTADDDDPTASSGDQQRQQEQQRHVAAQSPVPADEQTVPTDNGPYQKQPSQVANSNPAQQELVEKSCRTADGGHPAAVSGDQQRQQGKRKHKEACYPHVPSRTFPYPLSEKDKKAEMKVPDLPENDNVKWSYYGNQRESRTIVADVRGVMREEISAEALLYMRQVLQRPDLSLQWWGLCEGLDLNGILQEVEKGRTTDRNEHHEKFRVFEKVEQADGGSVWEEKDMTCAELVDFVAFARNVAEGREAEIHFSRHEHDGSYTKTGTLVSSKGGLYLLDLDLEDIPGLDRKYKTMLKIQGILPDGEYCAAYWVSLCSCPAGLPRCAKFVVHFENSTLLLSL